MISNGAYLKLETNIGIPLKCMYIIKSIFFIHQMKISVKETLDVTVYGSTFSKPQVLKADGEKLS